MRKTSSRSAFLVLAIMAVIATAIEFQGCGGEVEQPPDPVEGLVVIPGDRENIVTWNVSRNAASYNLYWDTMSGITINESSLRVGNKVTDLKSTVYFHTGLENGQKYYYIVTAVSQGGTESGPSYDEASGAPKSIVNCPSSQYLCTNVCVDLSTDDLNCGSCGTECPTGQLCVSGACEYDCPTGKTSCTGGCVDIQTDANNCGACSNVCAGSCSAGACV